MRAIDTNVLVRLLTRDNPAQTKVAETFVERGAWVPLLAVAETVWVLEAVYRRSAAQIVRAIEMLLDHAQLVIERRDVAIAALSHYRKQPRAGFSDCLMLEMARSAGHLPFGAFDKVLGKLDGAEQLRG